MEPNGQKRDEKFWADHLIQWKASGKSRRRYCVDEGLSYWTFRERLKRLGITPGPLNDLVQLPWKIAVRENEIQPGIDIFFKTLFNPMRPAHC